MTPAQYENWKILVNTCKGNYQNSINVGSDKMRDVIVAVDAALNEAFEEKVKERNAKLQLELFPNGESLL